MSSPHQVPSATLPKGERVRKRSEYLRIQGQGRKLHTSSFLVFAQERPTSAGAPARLGVTVSKRVGNAVERNRVKRLVREVYRRRKAAFPAGLDVVFVAKRQAVALDHARADEEIEKLCARGFSHRR
jgi:ribonuclease P protein component